MAAPSSSAKEIAPFLKNLRRMLDNEPPAVLRWTDDGSAFEIHDLERMAAQVLPIYFKHAKYSSFQRQLNYFHFRKWTRSRTAVCTFSNPHFQRDQPDLAWRISRKKSLPLATKQHQLKSGLKIALPTSTAIVDDVNIGLRSPTDAIAMVAQGPLFPHYHYDMNAVPSSAQAFDAASLEWIDTLYPSLEALSQLHDSPVYYDMEPLSVPPQMLLQL